MVQDVTGEELPEFLMLEIPAIGTPMQAVVVEPLRAMFPAAGPSYGAVIGKGLGYRSR